MINLIQVSNTFERLNYFNSLTSKQKKEAISDNRPEIVSLLKTSDNFKNLNNFNNLSLKQKKEAVAGKTGVKTVASQDFINKLSDLLERYNDENDNEDQGQRRLALAAVRLR